MMISIVGLVLTFSLVGFLALTILLMFAVGRRLVAVGLVLFGLALVAFFLAYFVAAERTVVHRSLRTFHQARDLATIRAETEAAALRHAADMQRAAEQVQRIEMQPIDQVLLPPEQQASVPQIAVVPQPPVPPQPPQPDTAVGEISSPQDMAIVSQANDGPHDTAPVEATAAEAAPVEQGVAAEETPPAEENPLAEEAPPANETPPAEEQPAVVAAAQVEEATLAPVPPATVPDAALASLTAAAALPATPESVADVAAEVAQPASGPAEPAWVRRRPDQVDGHQAMVLTSDPFEDRFACNEDLERRTRELILGVARERCRQQGLPGDLPIRVTFDEIGMVSRERFYQTRPTSLGDMVQAYQLTIMDDGFQGKLDQRIRDAVVDRRLIATGLASGGVLAVVSLLFGGFRFLARKAPDPLSA